MRYSSWASRQRSLGIPDPLEEMASLNESSHQTFLANRSALERRRAEMDQVHASGWRPLAGTPMMQPEPEKPSHPSEGQIEPPRAIHVTRNTHGGPFGRSIVDRVLDTYDR